MAPSFPQASTGVGWEYQAISDFTWQLQAAIENEVEGSIYTMSPDTPLSKANYKVPTPREGSKLHPEA